MAVKTGEDKVKGYTQKMFSPLLMQAFSVAVNGCKAPAKQIKI